MTQGEIDEVDLFAMPIFLLGSLFELELLYFGSLPLIGDPAATFAAPLGAELSVAAVLSIAALGVVAYTNEWDLGGMSSVQTYILIATLGLIIAPPFAPIIDNAISGGFGAVIALGIQSTGYTVLSYVG